jgi:hypothetical protein
VKEEESRVVVGGQAAGRGRRGRRAGRIHRGGSSLRVNVSRLEDLLRENASSLTFLGITLGVFVSRKFLILPLAIGLMLAQDKLAVPGLERARRAVSS